jgi:alkylation response protein AidB-like acyl-CoA dehydrogenase
LAAEAIEEARRLPEALAETAIRLGLMRMGAPAEVGGLEADPATIVRALEAIALVDASASWVVMIAATTSPMTATYPHEVSRAAFGPDDVWCGVAAPMGRARREDDGFRVSGRWPFGSGCEVATWMTGGCMVMDGEAPVTLPSGTPEVRMCLFPNSEVTINDTWRVSGLRGTGSHDWEVKSVFVPLERSTLLGVDVPWCPRPLFTFPIWGLLSLGIAGVALGIGRAAIDELVALAAKKTPSAALAAWPSGRRSRSRLRGRRRPYAAPGRSCSRPSMAPGPRRSAAGGRPCVSGRPSASPRRTWRTRRRA